MHRTTAARPAPTGPPRTCGTRSRAAAHSVPASVNTDTADNPASSATARLYPWSGATPTTRITIAIARWPR